MMKPTMSPNDQDKNQMNADEQRHVDFLRLLSANTKRLYAFVRILAFNNENDAEEVFQNTCLTLWKKFDQYDPAGDFGAWACRMAHFEALRLRDSHRKIKFMSDQALASLADAAMPITEQINDRRNALAHCVGRLDEKDVAMIKARYFESKLPREIAQTADRSVHAIYRELARVHGLLKRCVERATSKEAL